MQNPTMLYKSPGPHTTEGVSYEYVIVEDSDVEAHLAEGWHRNWVEAGKATNEAALKVNETKLAEVERELASLKAVHKGRGVWEVQDGSGVVIAGGLSKEEAQAQAGA